MHPLIGRRDERRGGADRRVPERGEQREGEALAGVLQDEVAGDAAVLAEDRRGRGRIGDAHLRRDGEAPQRVEPAPARVDEGPLQLKHALRRRFQGGIQNARAGGRQPARLARG